MKLDLDERFTATTAAADLIIKLPPPPPKPPQKHPVATATTTSTASFEAEMTHLNLKNPNFRQIAPANPRR